MSITSKLKSVVINARTSITTLISAFCLHSQHFLYFSQDRFTTLKNVLIYAPMKGATFNLFNDIFPLLSFNSRPREGSDFQQVFDEVRVMTFQFTPP